MTAFVAVWAVYGFAIKPTQDRIRTLERIIPDKQSELKQLRAGSAEYLALRHACERLQRRLAEQDPSFELLGFLETLIERHQLAEHVATMKPDPVPSQSPYAETSVTIELKSVSLGQLVRFLDAVENAEIVARIGTLHIRKDRAAEGKLASTMQIVAPHLPPTARAAGTP